MAEPDRAADPASDPDPPPPVNPLAGLPPVWPEPLLDAIAATVADRPSQVLVVLDDDPTGTQTVHDVVVLTSWTEEELAAELARSRCVFVLTNSRSLAEPDAVRRTEELAAALGAAARRAGVEPVLVSRSDSTLRGHYPAEVDALAARLGRAADPVVLLPAFTEGGRITVGGIHYARIGDEYRPVGSTEFARDATFGFAASALADWVEEKTGGRIAAGDVVRVGLDELRRGGPDAVARIVGGVADRAVIAVDAVEDRDIEVAVSGLLAAEAAGRRFLYRTAASFVRVRAGLARRPLLAGAELVGEGAASGGGLVVVGSHVPRSTEQLDRLRALPGVHPVELSVDEVLAGAEAEIERVTASAAEALAAGTDVVVFTSRRLRTAEDGAGSLALARSVSAAVCAVVAALPRPRFLVAKGGITSSDIATEALRVRRAVVVGQALAGVPVWELGEGSGHPGLRYVVFPGNVGEPDALAEVVSRCRDGRR